MNTTYRDSGNIQIVHVHVNRDGRMLSGKLLKAVKVISYLDPYADEPFYVETVSKLTLALYADDICLGCMPVDDMSAKRIYDVFNAAHICFTTDRAKQILEATIETCQKAAAKAIEDLKQSKLEEAERRREQARLNKMGQHPI